ncbi:hypothetical protein BC835DRAFT_1309669 [Cytidiella melzeri]|nr:hypothetical protein BC835DRAFT_1309669 [Cytidiella melzeri]
MLRRSANEQPLENPIVKAGRDAAVRLFGKPRTRLTSGSIGTNQLLVQRIWHGVVMHPDQHTPRDPQLDGEEARFRWDLQELYYYLLTKKGKDPTDPLNKRIIRAMTEFGLRVCGQRVVVVNRACITNVKYTVISMYFEFDEEKTNELTPAPSHHCSLSSTALKVYATNRQALTERITPVVVLTRSILVNELQTDKLRTSQLGIHSPSLSGRKLPRASTETRLRQAKEMRACEEHIWLRTSLGWAFSLCQLARCAKKSCVNKEKMIDRLPLRLPPNIGRRSVTGFRWARKAAVPCEQDMRWVRVNVFDVTEERKSPHVVVSQAATQQAYSQNLVLGARLLRLNLPVAESFGFNGDVISAPQLQVIWDPKNVFDHYVVREQAWISYVYDKL